MGETEMRESCLDCTRKHLAQAEVLMLEYATGDYPVHRWYAVGHLAEAADEIMQTYPSVAERIRKERIAYMENCQYEVDTAELIELVTALDDQINAAENEGMEKETGENDEA
jgi:ribosome biogenesis SPOUT family RNA methylase Rps3